MQIIFDLDYTLLDTAKLRHAIKDVFFKHGVSDEMFERTRAESRNGGRDWKPERQFDLLKEDGLSTENVSSLKQDFSSLLKKTQDFLYEDTLPLIQGVSEGNTLALVTYGESSFQNFKIDGCPDLRGHFKKILITQNIHKDVEVQELSAGEPVIFVEDNPSALSAAKKLSPQIVTVRIKRGEGVHKAEPSGYGVDHEISELQEVYKILS